MSAPSPLSYRAIPQTLLFDADDTLWENNIHFERAIGDFISYLDHGVHTPDEVREHLNRFEHATIALHGYGLKSFRRSLLACFEHLSNRKADADEQASIVAFADSIRRADVQPLAGVGETLAKLASRHRLLLVTKGDPEEQTAKLNRSGLRDYFAEVEVLAEKHREAYVELYQRHRCALQTTWMVGNSPRSDINPALAAGLNAVSIPHASTWVLEQEAISSPRNGQMLFELRTFAELLEYF